MSVDVTPDGKEIAFDLLGDLYSIPIGGGEAKALTTGVAWDMQPRYSPNGKWIAFTSDRGGGDNIWMMNRDGSKPKQVTKETFRLLNAAGLVAGRRVPRRPQALHLRALARRGRDVALSPQRRRRACSSPRSAPTRRTPASPRSRPTAAISTYSQDVTPGAVFEYNKDPNGADLRHPAPRPRDRRDRAATSPAPAARSARRRRRTASRSPSSAACATSRRSSCATWSRAARRRSTTGSTATCRRPGRSTASIRAWPGRPTAKSIVFWAGGKIHRIDVATKQVTDIPFHVKATRRVQEAVRFPVEVAPTSFDVKMLRWVAGLAAGRPGGLPGARPPLGQGPAERHAAPPDEADRPLRVLSRAARATAARSSTRPGTTRSSAPCASRRPPAAKDGW